MATSMFKSWSGMLACSWSGMLHLYIEWPHRQCVGLAYTWTRVRAPVAAASLATCM